MIPTCLGPVKSLAAPQGRPVDAHHGFARTLKRWPTVGNRPSATSENENVTVGRAVVQDVSERLQEFDKVGFLSWGETQLELIVVVIDHREEIRRTTIMEIRRMLPESP